MLVFGDAVERVEAGVKLDAVRAAAALAQAQPAGIERHAALVEALVEAGELLQGVADEAFHATGERDAPSAAVDAATALTMDLAAAVAASWSSGFSAQALAHDATGFDECRALRRDLVLRVRQPEGYAFYALYPESYLQATLRCPRGRWQVIGVRSIGTSLSCIAAVGLGARPPLTVRPVGPPFDRRIAADTDCIDRSAARFAIVDEGPGQSGSSLAAVARWLIEAGVLPSQLHWFASHDRGPGPAAPAWAQALWAAAAAAGRVHSASFDDLALEAAAPAQRLDSWVADVVGPLRQPLRDVGSGAWRALRFAAGSDWPPAHPWQERRKFIAATDGGRWLVKFAGLGRVGREKLARAGALAAAGFIAAPAGLRHGFLVEPWDDDSSSLSLPSVRRCGPWRARLLETVAPYLAFRARALPMPEDGGASLAALRAMARANSDEEFGARLAARCDARLAAVDRCSPPMRRVAIDGRLHAWEWRVRGDRIVKADALDHSAAHDLIGAQDIAWDVAGAVVEFELDDRETGRLVDAVSVSGGRAVSIALVELLRPCYLAFQLGLWRDAERAATDADELARLRAAGDRYAACLRALLEGRSVPAERPANGRP